MTRYLVSGTIPPLRFLGLKYTPPPAIPFAMPSPSPSDTVSNTVSPLKSKFDVNIT